jgi:elongation factor P--(R)-beta-lysine ligase
MSPGSNNNPSQGERGRLAAKKPFLWVRARMIQAMRRFFIDRGYLEIETPILIPAPAPECHIDAIRVGDLYLHTSPELSMKRLLAAGFPRIFQITKCFRSGERGRLHLPEFTLLEWYRCETDYLGLMEECEIMLLSVFETLQMKGEILYGKHRVNLRRPWKRMTVLEAFERYSPVSLEEALASDRFDELTVRAIEPEMGMDRPAFLMDYPASLAALARLKPSDVRFAERFELYIAGMELANGFSELNDAEEQRLRFDQENRIRVAQGKRAYLSPDRFLEALGHMPEASGIAVGIDRLVMLLTDRDRIDDVVCFTPEEV